MKVKLKLQILRREGSTKPWRSSAQTIIISVQYTIDKFIALTLYFPVVQHNSGDAAALRTNDRKIKNLIKKKHKYMILMCR